MIINTATVPLLKISGFDDAAIAPRSYIGALLLGISQPHLLRRHLSKPHHRPAHSYLLFYQLISIFYTYSEEYGYHYLFAHTNFEHATSLRHISYSGQPPHLVVLLELPAARAMTKLFDERL